MLTISRYLLRQFLVATAVVLVGLLATWIAADALLHLDELGEVLAIEPWAWKELLALARPLRRPQGRP